MRAWLVLILLIFASLPAHAGTRFAAMEQAIQKGEFKKIGSVLVSQDGRVIYEHYFDENATTLRDTRSATKSITAILAGIAIEDHQIAGVSSTVLSFFPAGACGIPIRVKQRSPLKTCSR